MLKYMIDAHQESLECSGDFMHLAAESTRLIQRNAVTPVWQSLTVK